MFNTRQCNFHALFVYTCSHTVCALSGGLCDFCRHKLALTKFNLKIEESDTLTDFRFNQSLVVARGECFDLHQHQHQHGHCLHRLCGLPVYIAGQKVAVPKITPWNPVSNVCSFRDTSTLLSGKRKAERQQKCFV